MRSYSQTVNLDSIEVDVEFVIQDVLHGDEVIGTEIVDIRRIMFEDHDLTPWKEHLFDPIVCELEAMQRIEIGWPA